MSISWFEEDFIIPLLPMCYHWKAQDVFFRGHPGLDRRTQMSKKGEMQNQNVHHKGNKWMGWVSGSYITNPVKISFRCAAVHIQLSLFLSWQDSVITHALSPELTIYLLVFWCFSNLLWSYWRGTSKSLWMKDCAVCYSAHSKSWMFSSLAQSSLIDLKRMSNEKVPFALRVNKLSDIFWLTFLDGGAHLQMHFSKMYVF